MENIRGIFLGYKCYWKLKMTTGNPQPSEETFGSQEFCFFPISTTFWWLQEKILGIFHTPKCLGREDEIFDDEPACLFGQMWWKTTLTSFHGIGNQTEYPTWRQKKKTCFFKSNCSSEELCFRCSLTAQTPWCCETRQGRSGLVPSLQTWWISKLQDVYLLVINGVIIPVNGLTIGLRGVITPISGVITLLITGTVHLVGFRWTSF